ncbi:MAG TPA: ABC transporter ATP-binding protein [bacterium]|nr:ABC transporter ATP-binding protein [bacterium]HPR87467.1 ABC transporter ATP-binding protein [bacterium]
MALYFRILRYLKPYWKSLLGSLVCIFFFTLFSSASLVSIIPFLGTIFDAPQSRQAAVQAPAQPAGGEIAAAAPAGSGPGLSASLRARLTRYKDQAVAWLTGGSRRDALKRLCLFIILMIFLKGFFDYFQSYLMAGVEQGVIRDIRNDLYRQINRLSLGYFTQTRTGQIISRITNDVTLVNSGVSASFVTLIKNPLLIITYLGIAIYLSWSLTLVALVVAPFTMGIVGWIGLKLKRESTISQERMANLTSVLQETIAGQRVVKAFAMEEFEIRKFSGEAHRYYETLLRITRTRNLASPLTEFLGTMIAVGILWFGGQQVLAGRMLSPEEFMGFLVIVFSLMQPVKELSTVHNRLQEAMAAAERIFAVLDLEPAVQSLPGAVAVAEFRDAIELREVTFSYGRGEEVLREVSLTVHKGEILAIVGPSGAGKSTLVDLIPRFYDPIRGSIALDGVDLRNLEVGHLRRLMGIVTQETILFNDSVRNNIAYGLDSKPLEEIVEAARIANAHDFIMQLPGGYETNIGERGVALSGGQRQRLAIARAVLKNPPILILDEATSALDTESEVLVQQAIERLMRNRTSFVIAHRLSTILHADRIIVLEKGRVVQSGVHAELVALPGVYQKLYSMQFRAMEVPE